MNGNPNAAQKRFHKELREMYYDPQFNNPIGELHHIWGSKANFKLLEEAEIEKAGEWFVIMIPKIIHDNIKDFDFDRERSWFLTQQQNYEVYYDRPSPMPAKCIEYYKTILSKQYVLKRWNNG